MLYREPIPTKQAYGLLAGVFCLLYLPLLGLRELQTGEALHLLSAREMLTSLDFLRCTVHGQPFAEFPLYAWLVAVPTALGVGPEWAVRLPAALSVLALAALAARMAARAGGHLAGVVAAAMVLGSACVLSEARQGGAEPVAALLLAGAWFSWYRLGRVRRRWGLAWCVGLLLALLAFFGIGIVAFLFFYYPFLFLRRPLRVWRRFWVPGHLVMGAAVIMVLGLWLYAAPEQTALPWKTIRSSLSAAGDGGVLAHLVTFPFACAVALLPWVFLAWPGFCVAFRAVERTPIFCRFLRTIVLSVWVTAWLLPGVEPAKLLPLVGPLAVLTGLHADILLRRHAGLILGLLRAMLWLTLALGGAGLVLLGLHTAGVVVFAGLEPARAVISAGLLAGALLLAGWLRRRGGADPLWLRLTLAVLAIQFCYLALYTPYRMLFYDRRRLSAQLLSGGLPPEVTVYKSHEGFLAAETTYIPRVLQRITSPADLPALEPVVFVLGPAKPPILETRRWEACSPPVNVRQRCGPRLAWAPAEEGLVRVEREWLPLEQESANSVVRMYRGILRPNVDQINSVRPAPPPAVEGIPGEAVQRSQPR